MAMPGFSSSVIVLDYDASLFEVKRVANGGLLRADPQFTTDGGRLTGSPRAAGQQAPGIGARPTLADCNGDEKEWTGGADFE